ncbi:MAG: hypothetical protein L0L69_08465 [Propionibacterium sp.]|nr:hypothetical protein [Propionibacterium sp.]
MAAAAATMIEPGATVNLDGGTTTLALVEALPTSFRGTIITHSPTIAAAALGHDVDVFLIGGQIFKHSAVACSAAAAEAASTISADMFFLGVTGIHPVAGLTTGDADEASMNRTLASRSAETQVLGSGPAEALLEGIPLLLRPLDASGGATASWELDNPSRVVVHGLRVRQPGLPDGELISARNMQLQHGLAHCHSGLLLALVAPDVERRRTGPGTAAEPTAYPPRSRAPSSRRMCAELAGFPPCGSRRGR